MQLAHDVSSVQTTRLGQRTGNHLQRFAILFDRVLVQARRTLTIRHNLPRQLNFCRTSARHQAGVTRQGLDCVHAILNRALSIIQHGCRRATQNNRR